MNADELEKVMLSLDWDDLFVDDTQREDQPFRRKRDDNLALYGPKIGIQKDASLLKRGVIAGQKISFLFESLVKDRTQVEDFDQLPIPYRAVAADIATGKKVVLSHGDLALAMRASMSVPGVFNPVEWGEHTLVDGGIVDNVPADVVRAMGADVLIVVDVGSGTLKREQLETALDIVAQMTNLMIQNNVDAQLATLTEQDILISPPLGDEVTSAGFDKTALGISIGFKAADAARQTLARLSVSEGAYQAHRQEIAGRVTSSPTIEFVRLDNQSRYDDSVLLSRLSIELGKPLNVDSLDADIREIYALGFMELVRYEVVTEGDQTGIVVRAGQDARGTRLLEWGADYFGNENGSAVNLRVAYLDTAVDRFGSEMRVMAQLGEDPALYGYLYKYVNPALKVYLEPTVFAERRVLTNYDSDGDALSSNEVTQYGASIAVGRELSRYAAVALGVRKFTGDVETRIGPPGQPGYDFDGGEYFLYASLDRMDDRYFPSSGEFVNAGYVKSSDSLGADEEFEQVKVDAFLARTYGKHSWIGGARYYETLDEEAPLYAQFRAGGFTKLSAYQRGELVGSNFAMVMGGYRYRFAGSGLMPGYLGMTLEYGEMTQDVDDLFEDAVFNGSVYMGYRSPIGPLYVGVGAGEGGRQTYFVTLGNIFGASTIGR